MTMLVTTPANQLVTAGLQNQLCRAPADKASMGSTMPHIQLSISESITDRRFKADEPIWIPLTTPP
jgi:hypothetical protein